MRTSLSGRYEECRFIVCKCKLLMSSVFCFYYPCFHSKSLISGAGFHDMELYACIYQMEYVTIIKITYLITYSHTHTHSQRRSVISALMLKIS